MRVLVQRVKHSSVTVNGKIQSSIGKGLLILLGVKNGDVETDARYLADRCAVLRIFEDAEGKMNLSIKDVQGEALVVSQFTLYGDTRKGNRPSYSEAAQPQIAETLYEVFVRQLRDTLGTSRVQTGVFRTMMDVELVNDGPVTLMIESKSPAHSQS